MELLPVVTVRGDGCHPELWEARERIPAHLRRGRTVRQVLDEAGPDLTVPVPLDERTRLLLTNAAALPGNAGLMDVATNGRIDVDVSRLADRDPEMVMALNDLDQSCSPKFPTWWRWSA